MTSKTDLQLNATRESRLLRTAILTVLKLESSSGTKNSSHVTFTMGKDILKYLTASASNLVMVAYGVIHPNEDAHLHLKGGALYDELRFLGDGVAGESVTVGRPAEGAHVMWVDHQWKGKFAASAMMQLLLTILPNRVKALLASPTSKPSRENLELEPGKIPSARFNCLMA
ncbi:hypothetical protein J6590_049171 [Homalodisca vitripennis]|nr:hypothetical protein J6590_049171 [Homalodisca vitripennis]